MKSFFQKTFSSRSESVRRTTRGRRQRLGLESLEARQVMAAAVISEVHVEPHFGNHDKEQYIELRGDANATLPSGTYFVTLEGWGGVTGGPGYIHSVINLSGLSFGRNGFLVIEQANNPYTVDPNATVIASSTTGFSGLPNNRWSDASTLSDRLAFIFTSGTFLLIQAPQAPVPASDADANDDGILDGAAANWNIIDSVGVLNTTASPSRSYGKITFSQEPDYLYPVGTQLIDTDAVGYVARIGASTGWAASDWVGGQTIDGDSSSAIKYRFTFGTFGDPRPLVYSGRNIDTTIGTYNFDGGARGYVAEDTNNDGAITSADTPLANVNVFADANNNGVRDSISTQIVAADYPEQSELTNLFPDATLTVADQNNKNIGFAVRTKTFTDPNFNAVTVLSKEGIQWFDSKNRLKVMFYKEADSVSIDSIGAEKLKPSYGRMEVYNSNDQLLEFAQTNSLFSPDRTTLSIARTQADIKYAIIYTNDNVANSSPFGPFDRLVYSFPEFQSKSDANGKYSIEELPPAQYNIVADGTPAGKIVLTDSSYPLVVTKSEHLTAGDFGFRNNRAPVITTTNVDVAENPTLNSKVGHVLATDPDNGQTLTYQFTGPAGPFVIDPNTGDIRVGNSTPWDFETSLPIVVGVKVTDSFSVPAFTEQSITISPTDVNEAPSISPAQFSVAENSLGGTFVGTVTASDPDSGANGTLRYSISSGPATAAFVIDPISGTLTVANGAVLDFETKSSWAVPVIVTDLGSPALSATAQITVRITDVNEPPKNITFTNVITVAESANASSGINVATVQVTDDALGTNTLSIGGPDATNFSIVSGTLRFQSASTLDFETKPKYVISVSADDTTVGTTPDVTVSFTLSITDVNEAPTGVQFNNALASIPESTNIATGVRVADLKAIDDALGTNNFSLTGTDASFFTIVGSELRLKSATSLDFETKPSLKVTVNVDDPTVGLSPDASATFTIAVADVNEPPTKVILNNKVATVAENITPSSGQVVADVQVVDDALGTNDLLVQGPDASAFEIVGTKLQIKQGTVFDYETKSSYSITVRAIDNTISSTAFQDVAYQLTVTNRPELVGITDAQGNPLGPTSKSVRIQWDSVANVDSDAVQVTKLDIGNVAIPTTSTSFNLNNKTYTDLHFTGPFATASGLADGTYSLSIVGSKVVSFPGSLTSYDFQSSPLTLIAPALPGSLDITAPSSVLTDGLFNVKLVLSGITPPPTGNVDFKIDLDGDGVVDRTESGPTTLNLSGLSYSIARSYTMLVTAEQNGVVLGAASKIIDVSPATTASENWLSGLDSNRDNNISPLDALVIINRINSRTGNDGVPYLLSADVDRDGTISALDVLKVINYLNSDAFTRTDPFSSLSLNVTGTAAGQTNDASISGKIVGTSRNLWLALDGVAKKDGSSFVQPDGSFAINDAAITQLFGSVDDGVHIVSLYTGFVGQYSSAADKRFVKVTHQLADFSVKSVLDVNGATRIQWTSAGSGARYNIYSGPSGSTPVLVKSDISATEASISLASGTYDLYVEAVDGAGNRKRTATITVTRP